MFDGTNAVGDPIYVSTDWDSPAIKLLDEPISLKKGQGIRFSCEYATWATAWTFVFDHPFSAVTGDNGAFHIGGLPAGSYTFRAWHEHFGTGEIVVTLTAGETSPQDIHLDK